MSLMKVVQDEQPDDLAKSAPAKKPAKARPRPQVSADDETGAPPELPGLSIAEIARSATAGRTKRAASSSAAKPKVSAQARREAEREANRRNSEAIARETSATSAAEKANVPPTERRASNGKGGTTSRMSDRDVQKTGVDAEPADAANLHEPIAKTGERFGHDQIRATSRTGEPENPPGESLLSKEDRATPLQVEIENQPDEAPLYSDDRKSSLAELIENQLAATQNAPLLKPSAHAVTENPSAQKANDAPTPKSHAPRKANVPANWDKSLAAWLKAGPWKTLRAAIRPGGRYSLTNIPAAAQAFALVGLTAELTTPRILQVHKVRTQDELANDLEAWGVPCVFFPHLEMKLGGAEALPDQELAAERIAALGKLSADFTGNILTTSSARMQPLPTPEHVESAKITLRKDEERDRDAWLAELEKAGYHREIEVVDRGQFSVRGAVVDFFSWHAFNPIRTEWMGDEIVSLREFEPGAQRSVRDLDEAVVSLAGLSEIAGAEHDGNSATLDDYLPANTIEFVLEVAKGDEPRDDDEDDISAREIVDLEFFAHDFLHAPRGDFILQEQRRDLFLDHLADWISEKWEIAIFCNNEGEQKRLMEIITETKLPLERIRFFQRPLLRGFVWPAGRLVVLSDAEIFGRYQTLRALRKQERLASLRTGNAALDFSDIKEGDYVVHLQHGIAFYRGLQNLPGEDGRETEVMALEFAEQSKLYVPVEQAYLVSKYVGVGKRIPSLDSLGGVRWERAKQAARKAVMDYASDLLRVQAERESAPGFAFGADTAWQSEFEEAFIYEETPDQLTAIHDTKQDMESTRPMDRLICGDVGFGKTEVAIRAAFKAVLAGKQVAFLVPTTVLAQQHAQNMQERFADYPIKVDVLSGYRTAKEQKETLAQLSTGGVDILVGTHRLISKDVKFKELGLVIVDEEQRFGVVQKEKFKQLFRLVDVLTLSATPIPRTLYLSLTGARDMSTIETPPAHRQAVETIIGPYDERVIRDAIRRELNRDGQVYFLHNRVHSIQTVADKLKLLVPEARIDIGHGQMEAGELEVVMRRFVAGETNVLLSTTIIESGLDIPNANTILIDRADLFGLADLYQLRGRVGRAQNKAYAYLFLPRHLMSATSDAKKRVTAIRQYSQLGAGFKIAMRDLEIRGAGNLLGTAQSGHISAVGFDLYCHLLKLAVAQMKGENAGAARRVDCKLQLDFVVWQDLDASEGQVAAFLPRTYLKESRWRIDGYRRIAELRTLEEMKKLQEEWRDRYGKWPKAVALLWQATEVKIRGSNARLSLIETQGEKLMLRQGNDWVMVGGKFPRLRSQKPAEKLKEIGEWIDALAAS